MRRQILPGGEPALIISKRCKILRDGLRINKYKYRKMKISGEERYTETPDKITPYADVADALQYLMLGGGEGRLNSGDSSRRSQVAEEGRRRDHDGETERFRNPLGVSEPEVARPSSTLPKAFVRLNGTALSTIQGRRTSSGPEWW